MKKNLLALMMFSLFLPVFGDEESVSNKIFELPVLREALLTKQIGMLDISNLKYYFLPEASISSSADFQGAFEDGFSNFSFSPAIGFSQKLPFLISLNCGLKSDMYKMEDESLYYSFTPSVNISLPIFITPAFSSVYNQSLKKEYRARKKSLLLDFDISKHSVVSKYISAVGNYLYNSELDKLYAEKAHLLEVQSRDYEKLFELGKITALELNEKISECTNFYQEQVDVKTRIISAEKEMFELGVLSENLDFTLSSFVQDWKEVYSSEEANIFYQEEKELLTLELSDYVSAQNYASKIPSISGGFSFKTPYTDYNLPDFSASTWNFSIALNLSLSDRFGYSAFAAVSKQNELIELKRCRNQSRKKHLLSERKSTVSLYESYSNTMKNAYEVEQKRLVTYEDLFSIGRISEFDLLVQKNNVSLALLNFEYADFQTLQAMASFY